MQIEILNRKITVHVDALIYNVDVLHKCFYWYGNNFDVQISTISDELFSIELQSKSDTENLLFTVEKIKQDLIDFKLRDIVTKETKSVRELIIAKAFAYYGLNDNPITEVSDPVGFDPGTIQPND